MAGYKETPRQKMIGMMYLVLTAMLALNVSVEILEAFVTVNDSVEQTNLTFEDKIEQLYGQFEQQYLINQAKVGPYWEKAKQADSMSTEMIDYIKTLKYEVIALTEKSTVEEIKHLSLSEINSRDSYDQPTNYFIGTSPDGSRGKARELKNKINSYKENMLALFDESMAININLGLETNKEYMDADGASQNWEIHHFYHTILAADVTFLNKLIMDVQNAEFAVLNYFYNNISAEDFKFDMINAKVIPRSNYVFLNGEYEAEVLVAAYDSKQAPTVRVMKDVTQLTTAMLDRATVLPGDSGVVKLRFPANSEGIHNYAGVIEVTGPDGSMNRYPFNDSYIVAKPSLTVAPTKMNVFYKGVENPVSISSPGIGTELLQVNISQGNLRRSENSDEWIVTIPEEASGMTTIKVSAEQHGEMVDMGSAEFRIKRVPSPVAKIGGTEGGQIEKNLLVTAAAIIPQMPEDFEFELVFEITKFDFVATQRGGDLFVRQGRGNRLTDEMLSFVKNARRGDKIWLENIFATGPDGTSRRLGTIDLTIK
ncbi:MAG: gliding motility protein GldM [Bacteroidia bacterium]|nr:gliding motility protein GldM [Bacteroidales bacterium]NCD40702.1 gliding motility protein GldM [Bacteroidia bacterium]MDD2322484.1 gliding motility protein GldM [Bacteroidales bacterium]MDD3961112.1 gliding motility protein GldM [Bacteroidales bacterium]MDY0284927.1 gliding motility protein GldM [Bacteroidales bacterium]